MKTKFLIAGIVTLGLITASCTKTEEVGLDKSLETSLKSNVKTLSDAVNEISSSSDFQLLGELNIESTLTQGLNQAPENNEFIPQDSVDIKLSAISGIYEYAWIKVKHQVPLMRYFNRTGDNENMIVRLPVKKVKNPGFLFRYSANDSTLTNNFEAVVSEYNVTRSIAAGKDYHLASAFSIDKSPVGAIKTHYTRNKINGYDYLSEYALANGYAIKYIENSGDTAVSSRSISQKNKTLYEEKVTSVKVINNDKKHRERTYSLTIGNVQIVRTPGKNSLDSASVFLNGVLQTNSKVEIVINNPDSLDQTIINKKRDLKITFDDGTSTLVSELTSSTIDNIALIFKTVRQAAFATDIIDRIAWNIYLKKQ